MRNKFPSRFLILLCIAGAVLSTGTASGERPSFFYTFDRMDGQRFSNVIHKVDAKTKQVLASVKLPDADLADLALSGDGRVLFAVGGDATVFVLDADRLVLRERFAVASRAFPWAGAIFAHPQSGLLYLARVGGSSPREVAIVDPRGRKLLKVLKLEGITTNGFAYDATRDRLYVTAAPPAILDPQRQRITGYIRLPTSHSVFEMLFLPGEGRLLMPADTEDPSAYRGTRPVLYVYDPGQDRVVRRSAALDLRNLVGVALSQDGTRLFAVTSRGGEPGTAVVIDVRSLTVLHTLTFEEPIGGFRPSPDGRGMWLTAKSGVLRLDDQTGQLLEPVRLPFRLSKFITPQ